MKKAKASKRAHNVAARIKRREEFAKLCEIAMDLLSGERYRALISVKEDMVNPICGGVK